MHHCLDQRCTHRIVLATRSLYFDVRQVSNAHPSTIYTRADSAARLSEGAEFEHRRERWTEPSRFSNWLRIQTGPSIPTLTNVKRPPNTLTGTPVSVADFVT